MSDPNVNRRAYKETQAVDRFLNGVGCTSTWLNDYAGARLAYDLPNSNRVIARISCYFFSGTASAHHDAA